LDNSSFQKNTEIANSQDELCFQFLKVQILTITKNALDYRLDLAPLKNQGKDLYRQNSQVYLHLSQQTSSLSLHIAIC